MHLYKLDIREPRLRRVLHGRITSYPVIEQFETQLSQPFYFRQKEHGTLVDVLFPKATESPQVAAFKKGTIYHYLPVSCREQAKLLSNDWLRQNSVLF